MSKQTEKYLKFEKPFRDKLMGSLNLIDNTLRGDLCLYFNYSHGCKGKEKVLGKLRKWDEKMTMLLEDMNE